MGEPETEVPKCTQQSQLYNTRFIVQSMTQTKDFNVGTSNMSCIVLLFETVLAAERAESRNIIFFMNSINIVCSLFQTVFKRCR